MRAVINGWTSTTCYVGDAKADALMVVKDIELKWKLYMGHRVRVVNQRRAIDAHVAELEAACVRQRKGTRALMTIDWKMKVRALRGGGGGGKALHRASTCSPEKPQPGVTA